MSKFPRRNKKKHLCGNHDSQDIPDIPLPRDYRDKIALLNSYVENNSDLIARSFCLNNQKKSHISAFYFCGVIDDAKLNEHVLKPLIMTTDDRTSIGLVKNRRIDLTNQLPVSLGQLQRTLNFQETVQGIFDGMLILIIEGMPEAMIFDIHGGSFRAIEEPPGEKAIRGPREGFIENLDINIAMVRRRLRTPHLVVKKIILGQRTRTPVALLYIDDIADQNLLSQLNERLQSIDLDGINNAGTIIQHIEDNPFSPFSQIWSSERPDKAIAELLEGRIAVLIDGTPTAIFLPSLFVEFFQAPEDYLERTFIGSFLRLLRFAAFFTAISLPALYVALISFSPELLPVNLVIGLAQARKEVPFPVMVEMLILEFIIQAVIESGLRLPGQVGQTVGVVAGIILGQAAIAAKLASPAVIIIIAVTTICTFALPTGPLVQSTRILRLPMIFAGATFGLYGFSLGWVILLTHLCSLESLGVPYFAPFAPMRFADLKDSFVRIWLWKMNERPLSIPTQEKKRQGETRKERKTNE